MDATDISNEIKSEKNLLIFLDHIDFFSFGKKKKKKKSDLQASYNNLQTFHCN